VRSGQCRDTECHLASEQSALHQCYWLLPGHAAIRYVALDNRCSSLNIIINIDNKIDILRPKGESGETLRREACLRWAGHIIISQNQEHVLQSHPEARPIVTHQHQAVRVTHPLTATLAWAPGTASVWCQSSFTSFQMIRRRRCSGARSCGRRGMSFCRAPPRAYHPLPCPPPSSTHGSSLHTSYLDGMFRLYFYRCDLTSRLRQWQLSVSDCGVDLTMAQSRQALVSDVMERRKPFEVLSVSFLPVTTRGLEAAIWTAQQRFFRSCYGHILSVEPVASTNHSCFNRFNCLIDA
jgi:hypothetical protein